MRRVRAHGPIVCAARAARSRPPRCRANANSHSACRLTRRSLQVLPLPVFKYPAPQIIMPTNGAKYWCTCELVLEWSLAGPPLADNEYFLVENKTR